MIVQLLNESLRTVSRARELFLHHNSEDFDVDWVSDQFNNVIDRIESLKEIASLRKEESDEVT